MKKRFWSLFLCLCMTLTLLPTASLAASLVNQVRLTMEKPQPNGVPAKTAALPETASTVVLKVEWDGAFDASGRFQNGQSYTVHVTLGIDPEVSRTFDPSKMDATINGLNATVETRSDTLLKVKYTWASLTADPVNTVILTMAEPAPGQVPPQTASTSKGANSVVEKVEWDGDFDGSGNFMAGKVYTAAITVGIKPGTYKVFNITKKENVTLNGENVEYKQVSDTQLVITKRYPFEAPKLPDVPLEQRTVITSLDIQMFQPVTGEEAPSWATPGLIQSIKVNGTAEDAQAAGKVYGKFTGWGGEMVTGHGAPTFKPGTIYLTTFDVVGLTYKFEPDKPVAITVNGRPAEYVNSNYVKVSARATVQTAALTGEEKVEADAAHLAQRAEDKAAMRSTRAPITTAEAAKLEAHPRNDVGVAILDDTNVPDGITIGYTKGFQDLDLFPQGMDQNRISTWIINVSTENFVNVYQMEQMASRFLNAPFGKELWLGPNLDIERFMGSFQGTMGNYKWLLNGSNGALTRDFTVFIPESRLQSVLDAMIVGPYPYQIKTYAGNDVYAAQKAGAAAAKDWCTNHQYTRMLPAADRAKQYAACGQGQEYYYSCATCGKIEYNDSHVFHWDEYKDEAVPGPGPKGGHSFDADIAVPAAYIGRNAAGDKMYWQSCRDCGIAYNEYAVSRENYEYTKPGMGADYTYEQHVKDEKDIMRTRIANAEIGTKAYPGMFTLAGPDLTAKVSGWAESDVNHALDEGLMDLSLLGNDYTQPISRLQFCSVAVRLAEQLTGKAITPAPAATFTDTQNAYALKAYAAGITTGATATTFDPNGNLTRAQMATFIHRALMYTQKNSDYKYTACDSKLASYTDAGQIQAWASEPMAFMNALGLVNGTTATTLAPNAACTIEQALIVAYRSVDAHQIGWYQCTKGVGGMARVDDRYQSSGELTGTSFINGTRIWVTGPRIGNKPFSQSYYPTVEPITGQKAWVLAEPFSPIRDN